MTQPDSAALATLLPLLRQLRDIKGLREARPGVFQIRGAPFVQFRDEGGTLYAELRKLGASGFDRYPVATPAEQRKLIDDAKRRAARSDDD